MSGGVRGGGATPPPTRFQYGSIRQWMAWGSADRLDSAAGDADKAKVGYSRNRTCPAQRLALGRSDLAELNPRPAPMTFSYRSWSAYVNSPEAYVNSPEAKIGPDDDEDEQDEG